MAALEPLPVEIVEHVSEPPSPWAGYQRCLERLPRCSHLLIIQDDAQPVPNFVPALGQIAASNPEIPVCLFISRLPRDVKPNLAQAMKRNQRYVQISLRSFMPIVAVLWPRQKAADFSQWAEQHPTLVGQREPRSDDAMAGRWKLQTRQTVRACVPSIVEHPDREPSIIGRRAQWGKDKNRVAAYLAEDALAYQW